jgi:hypothetical protein
VSGSNQPADKTSRINPVHISGLLALNPGPIEKNNNKEALSQPVRQKMVVHMLTFPINVTETPSRETISAAVITGQEATGDTVMPSMVSSSVSPFSTPSVAESVEFTETNPQDIDVIDKESSGDTVMNVIVHNRVTGRFLEFSNVYFRKVVVSIRIIFDTDRERIFSFF